MSMNDGVERDEEGYTSSDTEMNVRMVPLFNREESMFFLDLIGGEFKINKNSIFIEDAINQHQDDTGNRTWDGSIVLCKALEKTYARSDENESEQPPPYPPSSMLICSQCFLKGRIVRKLGRVMSLSVSTLDLGGSGGLHALVFSMRLVHFVCL